MRVTNMKTFRIIAHAALLAFGALFANAPASANAIYLFDQNVGCCNATSYGYVDLITNTGTDLKFTIHLYSPVQIHSSTAFDTFTFDMLAGASVSTFAATDTSVTWNNLGSGSYHEDGTGTWNWAIDTYRTDSAGPPPIVGCTAAGNPCGSMVTFEFTGTGLGLSSHLLNGVPVFFGLDIANPPGSNYTGYVAASLYNGETPPPGVVPIPGALWLFGSVLAGGAGIHRWRRKRKALPLTA
jgi:hypothetical protein